MAEIEAEGAAVVVTTMGAEVEEEDEVDSTESVLLRGQKTNALQAQTESYTPVSSAMDVTNPGTTLALAPMRHLEVGLDVLSPHNFVSV